jgi:LPXTG-site transpeptidase (sortase) family protein
MKSTILSITTLICSLFAGYFSYFGIFGPSFYGDEIFDSYFNQGAWAHTNPAEVAPEEISPFETYTKPIYTAPQLLILPNNQEISIFPLGVTAEGRLEVPENSMEGGWYYKSAKAGEEGNVLINAHYDDVHGRPAAFYNLKSVKVNDTVALVDSYDRQFPYRVTETYFISIYDEDRVEKLLESEGASLTLVTCGGFWLPGEGTYNQRLVVKATLEE